MMNVPTTKELAEQNLSVLEGNLSQQAPLNKRAFLRVLAVLEALAFTGMYKFALDRSKQNLALTARGQGLDDLGAEYDVPRKAATSAVITATVPATDGVTIPADARFVGTLNGMVYTMNLPSVATGGVATIQLTAIESGVSGNLSNGDTLTIVSQVPGAANLATVVTLVTTGAEAETDDEYAPRVQFAIRSTRGGGNPTDYKEWAEEVAGVVRAYPYSGKPFGSLDPSYPGDRTVYIQVNTDLNADGIPSLDLLAEVRAALNIDPVTGLARPVLGLVDGTLYVNAITRATFDVNIVGLVVPSGTLASVRSKISDALSSFFAGVFPYVLGVDMPQDQNDTITHPLINQIVQDILSSTGSSATAVEVKKGGIAVVSYRLNPGELPKMGALTYA